MKAVAFVPDAAVGVVQRRHRIRGAGAASRPEPSLGPRLPPCPYPSLRGDGSHALESLAPGELWVPQDTQFPNLHWSYIWREGICFGAWRQEDPPAKGTKDICKDTRTNIDIESTPTRGISEERDTMSHGPQKNVLKKNSFPATCELEKHQEIPRAKNIRRRARAPTRGSVAAPREARSQPGDALPAVPQSRLLRRVVSQSQWGSRKSRAPPGRPRAEVRLLEATVFWSGVGSKSSSPFLRGRPGDGSHAPNSLAPGELWVLQLFL
ncbi:Zinc finger protein 19 [Camelus dromedarius]|uniref:Zinc finger protein 19 n=1 Tax=Camelus dromedarius TaxID=9838 RepID=A0A5N4DQR2_CAMDR|nr:Zinc finger protein 19 [Camelus dromedarius]